MLAKTMGTITSSLDRVTAARFPPCVAEVFVMLPLFDRMLSRKLPGLT